MRYKIDLTLEQNDELMLHFVRYRKNGYGTDPSIINRDLRILHITSIEFLDNMFILSYRRNINMDSKVITFTSEYYSPFLEWFKPKMRDCKLEQLGI